MITLDAKNGSGQLLRIAITCSLLTGKEVLIKNLLNNYSVKGLNQSKINLLNALSDLKIIETKGVGVGSTQIIIKPVIKKHPKKIEINLNKPSSTILALDTIVLPLIFSGKKTTIKLMGTTIGNKSPPVNFYKETIWKYLQKYLKEQIFSETKLGVYPEMGELNVIFKAKEKLLKSTSDLKIVPKNNLATIKINLVGQNQSYLTRTEQLLKLIFKSKKLPLSVNTRISKNDITALTIIAYFGDSLGYDNDKPFIKGDDLLVNGELSENDLTNFISLFQEKLNKPCVDNHSAELLLPLLAIVGGKIPVCELTNHINSAIPLLEKLLNVEILYENGYLVCNGYKQSLILEKSSSEDILLENNSSEENIISIDDL